MNIKKLMIISFFSLIFNFTFLSPSSQSSLAQQIPISEGDTIEGQARNKKDIAHVNPIISVRFIEALTPYLPIKKVFMPQTFRIRVIFKTPPKGHLQPIVLSKIDRQTGKTKELFEASLISEGISSKTFITNPIGIKNEKNNWSPAEPYAFPLVTTSSKNVIQAAVGNQRTLVKTSDICNFLKMGISDISEIIRDPKQSYKPWFGKLMCSYITSGFKTPRSQADFVKTVLNALSRNFSGENWTLNSETNISKILILNSDNKKLSKKFNFSIKKTDNEKTLKLLKPGPSVIHIESSLFDNSSKTMDGKLVKAEKAILTIFGFKKASDMGIDLKKLETQKEDTKRTILKNINAFKKERLLKLNDNLILVNEKNNDLLQWLNKFNSTSSFKEETEVNSN
jgi:hypothetical protein